MATFILFNKGLPVHVTNESPWTGTPKLKEFPGIEYDQVRQSRDFKTFEEVEELAKWATEKTGAIWLA